MLSEEDEEGGKNRGDRTEQEGAGNREREIFKRESIR